MPHTVVCARYKQEMEGLDEPPFDSEFGQIQKVERVVLHFGARQLHEIVGERERPARSVLDPFKKLGDAR